MWSDIENDSRRINRSAYRLYCSSMGRFQTCMGLCRDEGPRLLNSNVVGEKLDILEGMERELYICASRMCPKIFRRHELAFRVTRLIP